MSLTKSQAVGLRIQELRRGQGLTRTQLCARVKRLSEKTLQDVEQGRHGGPSFPTMTAIAQALGVTVEALLAPPQGTAMPGRGQPRLESFAR